MKNTNRKPLMLLGLMTMIRIMIGAMIVIMMVFSKVGDMGQIMFGTSARDMITMILIMAFFFRKMVGRVGPMSMVTDRSHDAQQSGEDNNLTVLNCNIPTVSCGHCKETIEH